jgi:hypothetical protein
MRGSIGAGIAIVVLLAAGAGARQPGQGGVSNREVAAGVPAEFRALFESPGVRSGSEAEVWAGFPYDRIELERTACYGTCPEYRVRLFRGGRAELRALRHTERTGDFNGRISLSDYGKLCYLMKRLEFDRLPPRYTASWTDAPTFVVTAVSGETTKRVSDYSGVGPIELWAVQQAIDSMAERIRRTAR